MHEQEAIMAGKRFRSAIEPPYRWRDWAAKEDGITGDELIAFINNEEAIRPDGSKGPGLFAYLLSGKNTAATKLLWSTLNGGGKQFQRFENI
jgi:type I restriction enzyme M protein